MTSETGSVVNDFTMAVATVNGSGSASSNAILARTIFRMGVPVAPKNLFPSNISGLPTWFLIRVSEQGWRACTDERHVVLAMNEQTVAADIASVAPGGVLIVEDKLRGAKDIPRDDITVYRVPMSTIAKDFAPDVRLRRLMANMVSVGVMTELLGLDRAALDSTLVDHFQRKKKVIQLNQFTLEAGVKYAAEHLDKAACPFRVERRSATDGKLLILGNTATALGCLMGGCTFVSWYPITPSTSVCESFIDLCRKVRVDTKTGEARFASIQAEDELASIGLLMGAGWAGARAMTATSGPGISLMAELAGFGYYAEVPGVIVNVQRVGPSTGMPTRTQQGDISACLNLSHGDTGHILLLPTGPEELYAFAQQAFDLAERYQTPVFLMSDLDMGMNLWVSEPLPYPEQGFDRGKVLDAKALEKVADYERYRDVDGDGIPYRTLPGTAHPKAPYFTRGSGHASSGAYTEDGDEYREVIDRIRRKIEGSTARTPAPVMECAGEGAGEIGIVHYGSTSPAVDEARERLAETGIPTCTMRIRALPLHDSVIEFVNGCTTVYVAEQNRDGQMADILRMKVPGSAGKIRKILRYDGLPMTASVVVDGVRAGEREPAHV